jgi:regulator of telomere elongation helicase 1
MCVLGSRTQMCVHKDISQLSGAAQDFACRTAVASRSCAHHRAVEGYARSTNDDEPLDIEDMHEVGRAAGCGPCPYFLSRERSKVRDPLVVTPGSHCCIAWQLTSCGAVVMPV